VEEYFISKGGKSYVIEEVELLEVKDFEFVHYLVPLP